MERLFLEHNDIGPGGATALAGALRAHPALKHLNLCGNKASPARPCDPAREIRVPAEPA